MEEEEKAEKEKEDKFKAYRDLFSDIFYF